MDLIRLVSEHPCLYDPSDNQYVSYNARTKAWQSISEQLGEDCSKVMTKWRSIREYYARHKTSKVEFEWAKNMTFLDPFMDCSFEEVEIEARLIKSEPEDPLELESETELKSSSSVSMDAPGAKVELVDSDDLLYFKSLVPYMQEMEPLLRLKVRNRINDIVLEALAHQQSLKTKSKSVKA